MKPLLASLVSGILLLGCGREPSATEESAHCTPQFCYEMKDGMAMLEGDIVVGTEESMRAARGGSRHALTVQAGLGWGWANGRVPYVINAKLPNPTRVRDALTHIQQRTNLRFVPRTTQADYIAFKPWAQGYCRSWIGRIGGVQAIDLDPSCDLVSVVHEIGHAVGLWHEHTRKDRDQYIRVNMSNVLAGTQSNFVKQTQYATIVGPYDFASVMHYPWWAFSRNGQPTITRLDGSTTGLSNPTGLSAGDAAAIRRMYPTAP